MNPQRQIITPDKKETSSPNQRLFWVLLGLVAFGLIALIPYGLTLAGQTFSLSLVPQLAGQFIVQILLYSILILMGLKLSPRVGLSVSIFKNWVTGNKFEVNIKAIGRVVLTGLALGLGMILLDVYIFVPRLTAELQVVGEIGRPSAWQGFLAAFYGGIVEEVMMRFFLMTLLAWIGSKISRNEEGDPTSAVFWAAILISGLIFGLGHLPTAVAMGISLTPLYVIRTLVLNGVGIIYGWLYWKRGLESAMLAHFSTDIVVHFVGAFLI